MVRFIVILLVLFVAGPALAIELDVDNNNAIDVNRGGTNALTTADARTSLGAAAAADTDAHAADTDNPHNVSLSDVDDPETSKVFSLSNKTVDFQFTNPAGGMNWLFTGAASGHLLEILQTGGNLDTSAHLLHIEASDADPLMLHLVPGAATSRALKVNVPGENAGPGRFALDASGKMAWGDGIDPADATLERTGVGAMRLTGSMTVSDLAGTYTGGSAYVCVNDAGSIYASETACP